MEKTIDRKVEEHTIVLGGIKKKRKDEIKVLSDDN
jgi:hypothetical protein